MKFKTEAVLGLNYKTRAGHEPKNTPGVRTSCFITSSQITTYKFPWENAFQSRMPGTNFHFLHNQSEAFLLKNQKENEGGKMLPELPWWSRQAQALQGAWNGMGTAGYQQWQPEMLLCFYATHVLQFFSSNTGLKCAKSGTKRQLPEGELGEGRDFWFGSHWSLNQGGPGLTCDDTWFLFFNSLTDTLMLIKFSQVSSVSLKREHGEGRQTVSFLRTGISLSFFFPSGKFYSSQIYITQEQPLRKLREQFPPIHLFIFQPPQCWNHNPLINKYNLRKGFNFSMQLQNGRSLESNFTDSNHFPPTGTGAGLSPWNSSFLL